MKKTEFRASMDVLERRDTPSSVGSVAAAATTTKVIPVQGAGSGFVTQFANQVNGFRNQFGITGKAGKVGTFIAGPYSFNYFNGDAVGLVTVVAKNGDSLIMNLSGGVSNLGANTTTPARYKVTVVKGTGQFANATGTGVANSTYNLATNLAHFSFQVRAKVPTTTA